MERDAGHGTTTGTYDKGLTYSGTFRSHRPGELGTVQSNTSRALKNVRKSLTKRCLRVLSPTLPFRHSQ